MPVKYLKTKADFESCIAGGQTVAIVSTASWCGPCKMIGPKFEAMAADPQFASINFQKIDVDDNSEAAEACGITAMPTFKIFKGGKEVDQLTGASEDKLKAMLAKAC